MDFFSQQDKARRRTGVLVFYFCIAVILIIITVYYAVTACLMVLVLWAVKIKWIAPLFNPSLFAAVAGGICLIIGGASFYKIRQLSGPGCGRRIAELLCAQQVYHTTSDLNERKLLNIVMEMSIASGAPVPAVYILEERSINALAVGTSPCNAVIIVTRAAIMALSRDELQGIVAHEFSHIFNGDMRLNVRLIGVLHGILFLALAGAFLLKSRAHRWAMETAPPIALGLPFLFGVAVLFVILGYIGEFFARLIQMAVSRQREFLADACAVQFTRNPEGIAGALKKIGGLSAGSRIESPYAKAVCHLFFADGIKHLFSSIMSTHPDLKTRIRRIDPRWNGFFPTVILPKLDLKEPAAPAVQPASKSAAPIKGTTAAQATPAQVVMSVGTAAQQQVQAAQELINGLPAVFVQSSREPFGARAVVFALLTDTSEPIRRTQLAWLKGHTDAAVYREVDRLLVNAPALKAEHRLPLLELSIPALQSLSRSQADQFLANLDFMITADSRVSMFEMSLRYLVLRQYRQTFGKAVPSGNSKSLASVFSSAMQLLSMLAWYGNGQDRQRAQAAFAASAARIPGGAGLQPVPFDSLRPAQLEAVLDALASAAPGAKKNIIDACASCIMADRTVTLEEADLIRVIGSALDCPVPMFAPTQKN